MFDLNKHLDSNEKIIIFFRPSRKAYIFQYLFFIVIFALAIFLLFSSFLIKNNFNHLLIIILFWIVLAFSLIMLIRLEYRILSRKYAVTNERLLYSRGIFNEHFVSAMFNYITDISLHQNLWDKIINTGTLNINTAGGDEKEIRYREISNPLKIKKMINDISDKSKIHDKIRKK